METMETGKAGDAGARTSGAGTGAGSMGARAGGGGSGPAGPAPGAPEVDATGRALPRSWKRRVAVIWTGQAASYLATFAATFAAMWYITEHTASPSWLALGSIAGLLPVALLAPFGGVAADRFRRKVVMVAGDGTAGAFSLILALVVMSGTMTLPMLVALLAVRAAAQAFHGPALTAMMPQLVPERHLMRINALDQLLASLSGIVGPVAGILFYNLLGFHAILLLDAACAAAACACLALSDIPDHQGMGQTIGTVRDDLRDGIAAIWADKPTRSLLLTVMLGMMFFTPLGNLEPLMVYSWFGGDGYQVSLVEAVFGIGLLAGSAAVMAWGGDRRKVPVVLASGVAMGVMLICCGLLPRGGFAVFVVLFGLVAVMVGFYNAPILPLLQRRIPENRFGRVMGIFSAGTTLAAPAGLAISGLVAEAVGITTWFVICGALLAAVHLAAFASTSIRALDGGSGASGAPGA